MAVLLRAPWLKAEYPDVYKAITAEQAQPQSSMGKQRLTKQIEKLEAAENPDLQRIGYLRERVEGFFPDQEPAEPDLIVLTFPKSDVHRHLKKKPRISQRCRPCDRQRANGSRNSNSS